LAEVAAGVAVAEAVARATRRLTEAGCDSPRLDAELLLAFVLGVGRERLLLDRGRVVEPDALERLEPLVARREAREPVAYILGRKSFRYIELAVDRRVLIPRPETELLVEVGLDLPHGWAVTDLGTGSGAVALALKHERPDLSLTGTDSSADALMLAAANADALGLDVAFVHGDLLAGVECDAVLANLPYVESGARLAPEITRYEPRSALFSGSDGLDAIRRLVPMLGDVSLAALEIGSGQAAPVTAMLGAGGFPSVEVLRDLAGLDRVVVARR
jgi:release factor glutamine methyltransferase